MSLDISLYAVRRTEVFEANITHNLNRMAHEAGIYYHIWRPEEIDIKTAGELVAPLREGLDRMKAAPEHYKQFNPKNGWGNYDSLCTWIEKYLAACEENPDATIVVSR